MSDENVLYGKVSDSQQLGGLIRQKRKGLGRTQVNIAGLSGVGVRFLSELERGKPTMELGKAFKVLQRLGLEVWIVPRGVEPPRSAG